MEETNPARVTRNMEETNPARVTRNMSTLAQHEERPALKKTASFADLAEASAAGSCTR